MEEVFLRVTKESEFGYDPLDDEAKESDDALVELQDASDDELAAGAFSVCFVYISTYCN